MKKKIKAKNKLIEFLKTPYSIIIYLLLFIIFILIYTHNILNNIRLYVFNGYNENITIMNGSIYLDKNINNFTSSNIIYTGKELNLQEYEIGYYIKSNNKYNEISVKKSNNKVKNTFKLSAILDNLEFSFTEKTKLKKYFNDETIENINNLYFIIKGKTDKNKEINIEIPMEIALINK